jgi:murein DD-endopeptidase MepM/ murein hydrolase activator NlpD
MVPAADRQTGWTKRLPGLLWSIPPAFAIGAVIAGVGSAIVRSQRSQASEERPRASSESGTVLASAALAPDFLAPLGAMSPAASPEAGRAECEGSAGAPAASAEQAPTAPEPEPALDRVAGQLGPGATLFGVLAAEGVSPTLAARIGEALRPVFDLRRARAGHRYELARDAGGELVWFRYRVSPLEIYRIVAAGGEWIAEREELPVKRRRARLAGMVTTSLYDAVEQLGESPQLAHDLAEVFAFDVDFSHDARPGDEFRAVYERTYGIDDDGHEFYLGPDRVLAARYRGSRGEHTAVYFETDRGRGGYYRPDGTAVERAFVAAPLSYRRISSNFSLARLHPILGIRRPHPGIDYAAPSGSPVWSVADGRVLYKGWSGGFGRLVKVQHEDGYVSSYGHLSRFALGLAVGQRVRQKQVIGYVGASGLATGPHVCFRVSRNGRYVNPATLRTGFGSPIPPEWRRDFERWRDELLGVLTPPRLVATDEAL